MQEIIVAKKLTLSNRAYEFTVDRRKGEIPIRKSRLLSSTKPDEQKNTHQHIWLIISRDDGTSNGFVAFSETEAIKYLKQNCSDDWYIQRYKID